MAGTWQHDALHKTPSSAMPPLPETLTTPLSSLLRRKPVTCAPDTPVRAALALMRRERVGSILVAEADGKPAGVFTLNDLRDRVAVDECDLDRPIGAVMTPRPFCLGGQATALEAALAMARRLIHHVVVTAEDGRILGVVSEKDLFALQRLGVGNIAGGLAEAQDMEALEVAAADIRQLARMLMAQGLEAEQLTRLISELNDQLAQRILYLAFADAGLEDVSWCWLALGSEGRLEQTLLTDQDNGLIFAVPEGGSADALRERLLPVARQVNDWLAACGFPLCKGEIMAGNPKWCLSLEEWQGTFSEWLFRGDAPVLLNASIFFDFRALAGDVSLALSLREWLNERIKGNRRFLKLMTLNALGNRPPLGLVRDFVTDGEGDAAGTLDLKINGATLFVDAARIFALAAGATDTPTVARLRAAAAEWKLDEAEVGGWIEAFHHVQQLRLRLHQQQLAHDLPLTNRVAPSDLSTLDRTFLKESLRQAKKLQGKLEGFFQF
jgi:CBS domain-containing protein